MNGPVSAALSSFAGYPHSLTEAKNASNKFIYLSIYPRFLLQCSTRGAATSMDLQKPRATNSKRVLACVLCQQRKRKCDRKSPCSNCIKASSHASHPYHSTFLRFEKAKVVCIPSTPAPRSRRRNPNKDIIERLERCEQLLRRFERFLKMQICEKSFEA